MEFKVIPSFAKSYKKEYAFLFGIDSLFGEIVKLISYEYKTQKHWSYKASKLATRIETLIKEYEQGNGNLQNLNGKDVNEDVCHNLYKVSDYIAGHLGGFEYSLDDILYSIMGSLKLSNKKPNGILRKSLLFIRLQRVINYYKRVFKYKIIEDDLSDDEFDYNSYVSLVSYDTESCDDEQED